MYAAGKIPGGFFKREGRATERATLTARMIDRPIRPLWPKGFKNEVQVICTVLSADLVVPHDILCINGASAALSVSSLPFLGPVGAVRIGLVEGELVVNPTFQEMKESSTLDLIVVGTPRGADDDRGGRGPGARGHDAARRSSSRMPRSCASATRSRSCASTAGKPKWVDPELNAELADAHGEAMRARIDEVGLRDAGPIVDELLAEIGPSISMDSTEDDIVRELQLRNGLVTAARAGEGRGGRSRGPRASSRASCARSPTPSRTRRSSSRASATSC